MTDTLTVRLVVVFLGLFGVTGLAGLVWLVAIGTPADRCAIVAPPVTGALTALGALLASTRSTAQPQEVSVAPVATVTPEPPLPV